MMAPLSVTLLLVCALFSSGKLNDTKQLPNYIIIALCVHHTVIVETDAAYLAFPSLIRAAQLARKRRRCDCAMRRRPAATAFAPRPTAAGVPTR